MTLEEKHVRNEQMKAYKAEGHTAVEVAEHFGVSESIVYSVCKGIARQPGHVLTYEERTKRVKTTLREREAKAIEVINSVCKGFKYISGFKNTDSMVTLECSKCGRRAKYSYVNIRHGNCPSCKGCADIAKETEKLRKAEQRKAKERENIQRQYERQSERDTFLFMNTKLVQCIECGKVFKTLSENKVCCSPECTKHRQNRRKDRRISKDKRIDKNITATTLYRRDGGVCWICGGKCDLEDYIVTDTTTICGDNYPSVDHIVPICEGGADSWDNVRLAHRKCNTMRYWADSTPLGSKN